jgi:uncharacterized membrane protein
VRRIRGEYLILIGFVMVLLGAILPFLMVMQEIKSTIFLNFFSYILSVAGLFLGVTGLAFSVRTQKRKQREKMPPEEGPGNNQDW